MEYDLSDAYIVHRNGSAVLALFFSSVSFVIPLVFFPQKLPGSGYCTFPGGVFGCSRGFLIHSWCTCVAKCVMPRSSSCVQVPGVAVPACSI